MNNYQPELCEAARSKDLCRFKNLPSTSQQVGSDTSEGESPGAAAGRLMETPAAKSPIFQAYSLNISLWGGELPYSVLNSCGAEARQQNNSQLWLRSLGINRERRNHYRK